LLIVDLGFKPHEERSYNKKEVGAREVLGVTEARGPKVRLVVFQSEQA